MAGNLTFSIELFPPRENAGMEPFAETVGRLNTLGPSFCSVTYGAGGTTQAGTEAALGKLFDLGVTAPAGHLTCAGQGTTGVLDTARRWQQRGIRHIVALRGDAAGADTGGEAPFAGAADLVAAIRRLGVPEISVACYPEVHPRSASRDADLAYLKRKIDAGATRALSQFFFDPEVFLRFRDDAHRAGIDVPLVPGILPIHDLNRVCILAERCGSAVPSRVQDRLSRLEADPEARGQVAVSLAVGLCERLIQEGVRSFHFYTLNRPTMTLAICRAIGIQPAIELAA
jgi:methylenetetrahydrofolate reductase (NADPH)